MIQKKNIYNMSTTELIKELNLVNSTRKEIRRLLKKRVHSNIKLSNITDSKLIKLIEKGE